jgi:hypothetical protein
MLGLRVANYPGQPSLLPRASDRPSFSRAAFFILQNKGIYSILGELYGNNQSINQEEAP